MDLWKISDSYVVTQSEIQLTYTAIKPASDGWENIASECITYVFLNNCRKTVNVD
jgi:hypothetical protein